MLARVMGAMTIVILSTMLGGGLGGWVGHAIGLRSPDFVSKIATAERADLPPTFDPAAFGMGLGAVCGLFFGAGSSVAIVLAMAFRDAWVARVEVIHRSSA